jgi:HPt (histidine-containing phosphotransfer) domain-containing protein
MATIYDYPGSMRRMGDDQELFQEMVGLLRTDSPRWLSVVSAAQREGDPGRLQRAAHTLKGLAANFGAARAVAAAADVEQMAKSQQTAGLPAAVIELEKALDELVSRCHRREKYRRGKPALAINCGQKKVTLLIHWPAMNSFRSRGLLTGFVMVFAARRRQSCA